MVILILALLVLGPDRIPGVAAGLGKAIRSFRKATRELSQQIDIDEDVRRPFEDLRAALRDEPPPSPRLNLMAPAVPPVAAASQAPPAPSPAPDTPPPSPPAAEPAPPAPQAEPAK